MVFLLFDMLRIFILSEHMEYKKNLTLHLLCLLVGSGTDSPFWNFFKAAQPALNEDLCERELSSLARAVSNDTTGAKIEFCDRQFKLGSFVRNILDKWEEVRVTDNKNAKWAGARLNIQEEDPDIDLVSPYFLKQIRRLSAPDQFFSYSGDPKKWTTGAAGIASQKHVEAKMMLVPTSGHLLQLFEDVRRLVQTQTKKLDMKVWIPDLKAHQVPVPDIAPPVEPDIEELLARPPLAPIGDINDVLLDEDTGDEEEGPFRGDRKKDYVPRHLRTTCLPIDQVPINITAPETTLLFSAAKRKGRIPPKQRPKPKTTTVAARRAPRPLVEWDGAGGIRTRGQTPFPKAGSC